MDQEYLSRICEHFELGQLRATPIRVCGGLLHAMWCLESDKGAFALKQLSEKIDLNNQAIIKNYELSESIAERFGELGIPAVSAIKNYGQYLAIINGRGFLLFPWVHAKSLEPNPVSEPHALKIAELIAKMHQLDLDVPEISGANFDHHSNEVILDLLGPNDFSDELVVINNAYIKYTSTLNGNLVVCHGDLDQKNVLWDPQGQPILIDWESARKSYPIFDIVQESLNWSGITTDNFSPELFFRMIKAYERAGGKIDQNHWLATFYAAMGGWINWLVYNLQRKESTLGQEQASLALETIKRLSKFAGQIKKPLPKITFEENLSTDDENAIYQGLLAHNVEDTGLPLEEIRTKRFGLVVRADGAIKAGLVGSIKYTSLFIDTLWVDKSLRKQGLGRALLETAEQHGQHRGCRLAFLNTLTSANIAFYEKSGYVFEFARPNYLGQHAMSYFRKVLS